MPRKQTNEKAKGGGRVEVGCMYLALGALGVPTHSRGILKGVPEVCGWTSCPWCRQETHFFS